jgi:hypothetical protein
MMESGLLTIQQQFQNFLLRRDNRIYQSTIGTDGFPVDRRLDIYSNAYRCRLLEALESNYPTLKTLLGQDDFEKLGQTYISDYPSTNRSIRWFGEKLAYLLKNHPTYKNKPYLSELAQLEWTLTLVFDAADAPLLRVEDMATIAPECWINMRLQAHPSVFRLDLSWNVVALSQAISLKQTRPGPLQSPSPVKWIFWRKELINQFCSLPIDEAAAIDALLAGATFSAICEKLSEWVHEDEAAMRAATLLKSWIMADLMTSFKLNGDAQ